MLSYAANKGVTVDVDDLLSIAEKMYEKSVSFYKSGDFVRSEVYAHLSVEAARGARKVVEYELAKAGVPMLPPPPPLAPP